MESYTCIVLPWKTNILTHQGKKKCLTTLTKVLTECQAPDSFFSGYFFCFASKHTLAETLNMPCKNTNTG